MVLQARLWNCRDTRRSQHQGTGLLISANSRNDCHARFSRSGHSCGEDALQGSRCARAFTQQAARGKAWAGKILPGCEAREITAAATNGIVNEKRTPG